MKNGKTVARNARDGEKREVRSGREVALLAARAAIDKKAEELTLMDLTGRSGIADYFLLMTAGNERQVSAITDAVVSGLKKEKVTILGVEGEASAQWVLIDAGDVIGHVFSPEGRSFYDLDGLWPDSAKVEIPGAPPRRAEF